MKNQNRNVPYPIYPPYPGMMPGMPNMMGPMMPSPGMPCNSFDTSKIEEEIESLKKRVSYLENMAFSNTTQNGYNPSNYQVM